MSAEVKQARDLLLVARANRTAAKKVFQEACAGMFFEASHGRSLQKFDREIGEDYHGRTVITWGASKEYLEHEPSADQYREDCTAHPDFVAMCKAKQALREANRKHGAALRRLLTIGVKRGPKV